MSVVDEKKMNLLKMTERLLEISYDKTLESTLIGYEKLVCEIDNELYKSITDKIKSNDNYNDQPLEVQLETLVELEIDYANYDEFQKKVKDICKKCNIDIGLYDIEHIINIDSIRKRINDIKKYLENVRKIEQNKEDLNDLNQRLIEEEKKSEFIKKRLSELNEELRNNALKAEGRIYNSSNVLEYASIVVEAQSFGFDLKRMFSDSLLLQQELEKALGELNEVEEKFKTVQMCYDNNPNSEYKDIYLTTKDETLYKNYKYIFLEIISLIAKDDISYDEAKWKRNRLKELIETRINLLKQLNIKYLYDPFERVGINDQLGVIDAYGDNNLKVREIINFINFISHDNDNRINQNKELVISFRDKFDLMFDNTQFVNFLQSKSNSEEVDSINVEQTVLDNQVVGTSNLTSNFMLDRALKKTNGVIDRVYEIISNNGEIHDDNISSSYKVKPQLVIESVSSKKENIQTSDVNLFADENNDNFDNIFLDNTSPKVEEKQSDLDDTQSENLFLDLPFMIDSNEDEKNEVSAPKEESQTLFEEKQPENLFSNLPFMEDGNDDRTTFVSDEDDNHFYLDDFSTHDSIDSGITIPLLNKSTEVDKGVNDGVVVENTTSNLGTTIVDASSNEQSKQLFQEVQPFDNVLLFNDRYDNGTNDVSASNIRNLRIDLSDNDTVSGPTTISNGNNNSNINREDATSITLIDDADDFWTVKESADGETIDDEIKVRKLAA